MPRSTLRSLLPAGLAGAAVTLAACAETSKAPPSVTAPSASETAQTPSQVASQPAASQPPAPTATAAPTVSVAPAVVVAPSATAGTPPVSSTGPGAVAATTVPAQYRACRSDADCVAIPRAGCCVNGWKEAVASSQKDAYERAFTCTTKPRPMCPMYIVNDARIAKCEAQSHLCVMVQP